MPVDGLINMPVLGWITKPDRVSIRSPVRGSTAGVVSGARVAGSITAALFLAEFVGETPWAHVDIAGTAQQPAVRTWRNKGASGFGAKLLIELATGFAVPQAVAAAQTAAAARAALNGAVTVGLAMAVPLVR